jgi:hypothetical protein
VSLADNIALPVWALNQYGHELVEQIIRERPEPWIVDSSGFKMEVYRATSSADPVAKLRRLYKDWLEREFALLDARGKASGVWDEEASRAIFGTEDNNALIRRVLSETKNVVPYARMAIKERADGSAQVAA